MTLLSAPRGFVTSALAALVWFAVSTAAAAPLLRQHAQFIDRYCASCHNDVDRKGEFDLTSFSFSGEPENFAQSVKVHDHVNSGEMPPKEKKAVPATERVAFVRALAETLTALERASFKDGGRATRRRLNRYEYENALRDLLQAPWLQVKDTLPEDGEAFRFNKVGDALDISHVQLARYLQTADYALRQVIAKQVDRPETKTSRYYARQQGSFTRPMKFTPFNTSPERATFPLLGFEPQPDVRAEKAPMTVGAADPENRELEAVGVVASSYEPLEPKFNQFRAPVAGRYRLRLNAFSIWVGPGKPPTDPKRPHRWWIPDLDEVTRGRRSEPITLYSETPPRLLRRLGAFDVTPEPIVNELEVWLLQGEMIRPDPARLFRSRPGSARWQNPLAETDGQPGVAFRWLEVEGPLVDAWPSAGHQLLFGNLSFKKVDKPAPGTAPIEVIAPDPMRDAERLLGNFIGRAYRRPVAAKETQRFLPVVEKALQTGARFTDAMIAGYTAVLCSPEFLCLEEKPGRLDDHAVASRLAFFLSNSAPDDELRAVAAQGKLRRPEVLRAQTERLLNAPQSQRFVEAFLDYWLDLRRLGATSPDSTLYGDYYLDDLLAESALAETQDFFAELVRQDLPSRTIVAADFAMLNERLALHYAIPGVEGVAIRRVPLPADSYRGGLLTQASVLKVTANGTTTSPVLRGAWIMERVLGQRPPPPPPSIPAVEPDIRGATTIRQLLDKHRTEESCAACHRKIDPAGFALEQFDVMGAFREKYRALSDPKTAHKGFGHGGQPHAFNYGPAVDPTGELPDGRKFNDVRELKRLLVADEIQLARNLAQQLTVFATGAPVRFSDRAAIEKILERSRGRQFGVRTLIHEIVQSELFLSK